MIGLVVVLAVAGVALAVTKPFATGGQSRPGVAFQQGEVEHAKEGGIGEEGVVLLEFDFAPADEEAGATDPYGSFYFGEFAF